MLRVAGYHFMIEFISKKIHGRDGNMTAGTILLKAALASSHYVFHDRPDCSFQDLVQVHFSII